jgi:hypothetical protein
MNIIYNLKVLEPYHFFSKVFTVVTLIYIKIPVPNQHLLESN